jgi:ketosteroid isomerase-like protein
VGEPTTEETVMSTQEVADALVSMWKRGQFAESGEKYWADDVVSVEPSGPPGMDPVSRGKDAARAKGEWWANAHETHGVSVTGPFVNGDQFIVGFEMDVTAKETGQRFTMKEEALYTIRDGKIAEERFFYGGEG